MHERPDTTGDNTRPSPRRKPTLWMVLGIVVLALGACCIASVVAGRLGYSLFSTSTAAPEDTITLVNEAALQGDAEIFARYFDADAVTEGAYDSVVTYVKGTADYAELVGQFGEDEADRILRDQVLPRDRFLEHMAEVLDVETIGEGSAPFPSFTIKETSVDGARAEVTIVTVEDGTDVTYVLGMTKEMYEGEQVWRITEIRNMAELLDLLAAEL